MPGAQIAAEVIEALVVLFENAPGIIDAIQNHDALTDEKKAELIARVEAARAKVNAVQSRDV